MPSLVVSPLGNRAGAVLAATGRAGLPGQLLSGLLLGLVWAPCAGPTQLRSGRILTCAL